MRDADIMRLIEAHVQANDLCGEHAIEVRHAYDCARPDGGECSCTPQILTGNAIDERLKDRTPDEVVFFPDGARRAHG